jgi:hypothetical protein
MSTSRVVSNLPVVLMAFSMGFMPSPAEASFADFLFGNKIERSVEAIDHMLDQSIDQFLNGADDISKKLLNDGANEGRLALVQASNEMQVSIATARSQFSAEMGKQVANASSELKPILVELERWRQGKDDILDRAVALEDMVAMDMDKLPLGKDYFGIRRVHGAVFVQGAKRVYKIRITGPDFGHDTTGRTVNVSAELDGKDLGSGERFPPFDIVYSVNADDIANKFDAEKIVLLPLNIRVERTEKGGLYDSTSEPLLQKMNVALLPDKVGELEVQTLRPRYEWKPGEPLVLVAEIAADRSFAFQVDRPVKTVNPEDGNQKLGRDYKAECGPVIRNGYELPNGTQILESHPLLQQGWEDPDWIGADASTDCDRATAHSFAALGIKYPFWRNNRCPKGQHSKLTPSEIKSFSKPILMSVQDCPRMRISDENWGSNDGSFSVWVKGSPAYECKWTLTVPTYVYTQTGSSKDRLQTIPVFASKPVEFEIFDQAQTATSLKFIPKNDVEKVVTLGQSVSKELQFRDNPLIGQHIRHYYYSFTYDTRDWQ